MWGKSDIRLDRLLPRGIENYYRKLNEINIINFSEITGIIVWTFRVLIQRKGITKTEFQSRYG